MFRKARFDVTVMVEAHGAVMVKAMSATPTIAAESAIDGVIDPSTGNLVPGIAATVAVTAR